MRGKGKAWGANIVEDFGALAPGAKQDLCATFTSTTAWRRPVGSLHGRRSSMARTARTSFCAVYGFCRKLPSVITPWLLAITSSP